MSSYSVRLLIRCTGKGQPRQVPLYEDRLVLVRASSHDNAKAKAKRLVAQQMVPHKNVLGYMVRWRVIKAYESVDLFADEFEGGKFKDGAQVYWRYMHSSNHAKRLKHEGTMNALYRE